MSLLATCLMCLPNEVAGAICEIDFIYGAKPTGYFYYKMHLLPVDHKNCKTYFQYINDTKYYDSYFKLPDGGTLPDVGINEEVTHIVSNCVHLVCTSHRLM